ncbi:MAG: M56 family metallopeptidase [Armatimonadota bacterium]
MLDPHVSRWICEALWRASLQGGVALAVAWIICRFWIHMPASARVWIWRIAYLEMIVSLCWAGTITLGFWSVSKSSTYSPGTSRQAIVQLSQTSHKYSPPSIRHSKIIKQQMTDNRGALTTQRSDLHISNYLCGIWLLGVCWGFVRLLIGRRSASRLWLASKLVERTELYSTISELCSDMKIRNEPRLLAGDAGPMIVGVLHPAIILPESMLEKNDRQLRMAMAHELAHVRRRDLLWNRLSALTEIIFFFHPLVWVAASESQLAQEIACDETAIRYTKSAGAEYAEMLVAVAAGSIRSPHYATAALGVSESFAALKRRLHAMRMYHEITRKQVVIAGLVVLGLGAILLAWRVVPQPPKKGYSGGYLSELIVSPDSRHVAVMYKEDLTSRPGKRIYAGKLRYNVMIQIRDIATGKLEHQIDKQNSGKVFKIAFTPDSRSLLITYQKPVISFVPHSQCDRFDLASGKTYSQMDDLRYFWISKNGTTLWTDEGGPCINDGYEYHAYLVGRDVNIGKELCKLPPFIGRVVDVSPDRTKAVTNCYGYTLASDRRVTGYTKVGMIVWSLADGKQLVKLEGIGKYPSFATAISPNSTMFAASEQNEDYSSYPQKTLPVRIWDMRTGKTICTLTGNTSNLRNIEFSPDGRKLVGVDFDGHVILWDIQDKKPDWVYQNDELMRVAFTPDGAKIIAGAEHNTRTPSKPYWIPAPLTIMDANTGQVLQKINL